MNFSEIAQTFLYFGAAFISFYGYGSLISRVTFPEWKSYFGFKTLLGVLTFLILSGYIELFRLGSYQLFRNLIVIGVCIAFLVNINEFLRLIKPTKESRALNSNSRLKYGRWLAIFSVSALIFAYCLNAIYYPFNPGDDYSSYIIFPIRILSEGFSGGDYFNQRGIEHGLGGGDYINALIFSAAPLAHLHIAEAGTGFLLLALLCIDHVLLSGKKFWVSYAAFLVALIVAIFAQYTNVSPILLGCAIAYGILLFGQKLSPSYTPREGALLGLLCGGLILLKGNLIAPAFLFVGVAAISQIIGHQKISVLRNFLIALVGLVAILTPWMLASHTNHGTYFYPLLGKGFSHSGGFGFVTKPEFLDAVSEFLPLYGLLLVSWLTFWTRSNSSDNRRFATILCALTIPSTLVLALTPAGMYRYCYVILATPCAFLIINNLCILGDKIRNPLRPLDLRYTKYLVFFTLTIASILMLNQTKRVGRHLFTDGMYTRMYVFDRSTAADTDILSAHISENASRYKKMQAIVPNKEIILSQVEAPFLLDFSRNKIYVMDYPGNAGPTKLPFNESAEDMAKYLRSHNIRYVMHSYRHWISKRNSEYFIKYCLNAAGQWGRTLAEREQLVNNQLLELGKIYKPIYDDGRDRIIDLCQSPSKPTVTCK
ncbi:hypothetical protein [Polynucleobacter sp. MWH-Adler-W8]|jgi:hypothetical protein|uniref:hypothetical protein n=1 Tax=Polynucleobacter sp. MWH-Adler-W8 TaxID=1819727 RepID=UPI0009263E7D|nr:hypothetical protein [Polynucleobacter sp. MWH-Adler-W8]OJI04621.1 hypothetical protein AOC28_06645 [Polynucleobacter sp. MWH-Adler-W8]